MQDALQALEFDRVRQALAQRAATFMGQEAALQWGPWASLGQALQWQATVAEALGYPYRLGGIHDLRPAMVAAREGRRLEGIQLLEAAHTLEAATLLKHELLDVGQQLSVLAAGIGEHALFQRRVRECLEEGGSVRDAATPRLKQIRQSLNPLRERIQDRLYNLMDRQSSAIQERFITLRRDRYVIPVKASHQNQIPGIVLDQSDSGVTLFIEPASVVPLNNQLYSLRLEEEAEVQRILFELTGLLATDPELEATLQALVQLDLARCSAALAEDWRLVRPRLGSRETFELRGARHPLIDQAVANDLALNPQTRLLLLTGPNMGGKTALLKTLGLLVLMAQSGLYVAAQQASLPFIQQIYVDIGDQQSLQQNLSTFAGHLVALRQVLEEASPHSLVLIDELGSGTDPEEGAALSQAFLEGLLVRNCYGLITTHLAPLKAFAQETPGVHNASMRFDLEQLRPTYQLITGAPGRSYALAIAERLDFPTPQVERARQLLGPEGGRLEQLLTALEEERQQLHLLQQRHQQREERLSALEAQLSAERQALEQNRARLLEEAEQEALTLVAEAQDLIRKSREKASKGKGQTSESLRELMELRGRYHKPAAPPPTAPNLQVGSRVEVPEYGSQATILEIRGQEAVVQLGAVRMTLALERLQPGRATQEKAPTRLRQKSNFPAEINLRGFTVEEALLTLDDYLREAASVGQSPVRVLHGKGTGALRLAIREALKRDRRVEQFHDAVPYEGGHGVTVVTLRQG
jgi:DNA mismatch repair protein MutS2